MAIIIKSRHTLAESLKKRFSEAIIIDVTSRAPEPWVRFSPFYPHGRIPVPFSPGCFGTTVEGIWQGLKVFETTDIDPAKLEITNMKGIKRSERKYGKVLGHRAGLEGKELLGYGEARRKIYLPTYLWMLENCVQAQLNELNDICLNHTVVLLDYETNTEVADLSRPLSHAGLIKLYLEGNWPVQ